MSDLTPRAKAGARILIVEDDRDTALFFRELMRREGHETVVRASGEEAMESLAQGGDFDLVLLDMVLPGMSGWEVLRHIKSDGKLRYTPVVVLSAVKDKERSLEALDMGAEDYISKPADVDTLISRVRVMLRIRSLYEDLNLERFGRRQALKTLEMRRYLARVMGGSAKVLEMADVLDNVVSTDTTVLLEGESGTGKSLLAEAIHLHSKRDQGPFVVVNCSAYPETLLASELFGHEKGAFTGAIRRKVGRFELADGGTIFLDEIAEISPLTQLALLRVIQDRSFERVGGEKTVVVDVRIVAATNKPLREMVEKGLFREDLFYRLNVVRLEVPPLRFRNEDIPFLANQFLQSHAEKVGKVIYGFSQPALVRLMAHTWPGNVRELRNVVEHAVLMCQGEVVEQENLPPHLAGSNGGQSTSRSGRLRSAERQLVRDTLEKAGWNKYQAAKMLGISRSTLYGKIAKYNLEPSEPA